MQPQCRFQIRLLHRQGAGATVFCGGSTTCTNTCKQANTHPPTRAPDASLRWCTCTDRTEARNDAQQSRPPPASHPRGAFSFSLSLSFLFRFRFRFPFPFRFLFPFRFPFSLSVPAFLFFFGCPTISLHAHGRRASSTMYSTHNHAHVVHSITSCAVHLELHCTTAGIESATGRPVMGGIELSVVNGSIGYSTFSGSWSPCSACCTVPMHMDMDAPRPLENVK